MKLQEMSTKLLLALHNSIADSPAGPKSFATKATLITRIESIVAASSINLALFEQLKTAEVAEQHMQLQATVADAADTSFRADKKPCGNGVGRMARELLLDRAGLPYKDIANRVNAAILGAHATAKSVCWYAHDMRKNGVEVPPRRKQPVDIHGRLTTIDTTLFLKNS